MCRSRPSLPRAALFSLPHRRRITLHALLFSASSARTVLFLLFSCSSSVVLRRTQPQGGTTGTAQPDRAHHRVRGDPLRRGGPLKGGRRLFKAPPRQLHVADNGGLLTPAHRTQPLHAAGTSPEAPCAANGHTQGMSVLGETRQPSAGGRTSSQAVSSGQ